MRWQGKLFCGNRRSDPHIIVTLRTVLIVGNIQAPRHQFLAQNNCLQYFVAGTGTGDYGGAWDWDWDWGARTRITN